MTEFRVLDEQEYPHIRRLSWDWWNLDHITKHGLTVEEVEEMIAGSPKFRQSHSGRLLAVGPTRAGLVISVAIGEDPEEPGVYYAFSARPVSKQDLRWYTQ